MASASIGILEKARREGWTDMQVVERVKDGETGLYEIIMRRYNQRLYRAARAILRDDSEAEDVLQDAYVRAYQHLDQYRGAAPFSTWLTRIAVNEALHRLRLRRRSPQMDDIEDDGDPFMNVVEPSPNPEERATVAELGRVLEDAVLALPAQYRAVVMLRDIEGLTTTETADVLDLTEENVKVRLHRGRMMAREWMTDRIGARAQDAFPFMGNRCDRVVAAVFSRIAKLGGARPNPPHAG